jgi:hypothetical protein
MSEHLEAAVAAAETEIEASHAAVAAETAVEAAEAAIALAEIQAAETVANAVEEIGAVEQLVEQHEDELEWTRTQITELKAGQEAIAASLGLISLTLSSMEARLPQEVIAETTHHASGEDHLEAVTETAEETPQEVIAEQIPQSVADLPRKRLRPRL